MKSLSENPVPMQATGASVAAAKEAALKDLRAAVVRMAADKGHVLGTWHELGDDGTEVAYCQNDHCRRRVEIDIERDPHFAGSAISEVCGSVR